MADHGDGKSILDSLGSSGGVWSVLAAIAGATLTGFFNFFRKPPKSESAVTQIVEALRLANTTIMHLSERLAKAEEKIKELEEKLGICRGDQVEA
jgi:hypothetical protein